MVAAALARALGDHLRDLATTGGAMSLQDAAVLLRTTQEKARAHVMRCNTIRLDGDTLHFDAPFDRPCRCRADLIALLKAYHPYGVKYDDLYGCYAHVTDDLNALVFDGRCRRLLTERREPFVVWREPGRQRAHGALRALFAERQGG